MLAIALKILVDLYGHPHSLFTTHGKPVNGAIAERLQELAGIHLQKKGEVVTVRSIL